MSQSKRIRALRRIRQGAAGPTAENEAPLAHPFFPRAAPPQKKAASFFSFFPQILDFDLPFTADTAQSLPIASHESRDEARLRDATPKGASRRYNLGLWPSRRRHAPLGRDLALAPRLGSRPSLPARGAGSQPTVKDFVMITLSTLRKMKKDGVKIAMLTAYDASFAKLEEDSGVDMILIGDSLAMTIQGLGSTLPVGMDDMCYHTRCVAKGAQNAFIVTDLPFGAYHRSKEQAYDSAVMAMKAGASMVKLEGTRQIVDTVRFLSERAIPVCAHIGLTPQFVNAFGGYKVQGRGDAGDELADCALELEAAGASMVLMECVPRELGKRITNSLKCPTIGIGAGPDCDGQVLVMHDMLNVFPGKKAKFVRDFMTGSGGIGEAFKAYVAAVKDGSFPSSEETYD